MNWPHATVVPVGPYQGSVLVWGGDALFFPCNRTLRGYINHLAGFNRWALVDPTQDPSASTGPTGQPMFRNYWMDLGGVNQSPDGTLFCSSGAWDEDGRFVVFGGNTKDAVPFAGCKIVATFEPGVFDGSLWVQDTGLWTNHTSAAALADDRWYDGVCFLDQNSRRFGIFGGIGLSPDTYESYTYPFAVGAVPAFETHTGSNRLFRGPGTSYPRFRWFPTLVKLTTDRMFYGARDDVTARLQHVAGSDASWTPLTGTGQAEPVALIAPNFNQQFDIIIRISSSPRRVDVCNASSTPLNWVLGVPPAGLPAPLHSHFDASVVILPDGSLFLVGEGDQAGNNVAELLCFRDVPLEWRQIVNPANSGGPRRYHSCAVLLPDARVLVIGGENRDSNFMNQGSDFAIFQPYYLLGGYRPTLLTAPQAMKYQTSPGGPWLYSFACTNSGVPGVTIDKIVLMRPCMSTHGSDREQRYIELQVDEQLIDMNNNVVLVVRPPPSPTHAPPGYYMAFAVTNQGRPSVAKWVRVAR